MKRYLFIAAMAILAVSCQKTEIQNEVNTLIRFSQGVNKQTKAIAQTNSYLNSQPFAVYAYGWHSGVANTDRVMENVEITFKEGDDTATPAVPDKWNASTNDNRSTVYYWPNDPRTVINFYAYSPAVATVNQAETVAEHQTLHFSSEAGSGLAHDETDGLTLTDYTHTNMYVDFMVSTPVIGATYSNPDADANAVITTDGIVPVKFNHQMTQIIFKVTTDKPYPNVTFTVESIKLKNVRNIADYEHDTYTNDYEDTDTKFTHGVWKNQDIMDNSEPYVIFPADSDNGAVFEDGRLTVDGDATLEKEIALSYAADATATVSMFTTPVTMIPQDMEEAAEAQLAGEDNLSEETNAQMFEIKYRIEGDGVAEETVIKHVPFFAKDAIASTIVNWNNNQKITYTVTIGLKEITFKPSVQAWEPMTGNTYEFAQ